jgi:cytochrome oxidase Cu insertion factor (SCO1/SenC/PrrC family)
MRILSRFALALAIAALPGAAIAQNQKGQKKSEEDFVKETPAIGDTLPDLTVNSPDGKEVKTSSLRGQHVVLTFGCLT